MRMFAWIAVPVLGILMGGPHTLREQLQDAGIPQDSFNPAELDALVDGFSSEDNQLTYFVYVQTNDGGLTGFPQVVRYDTSHNTLRRAEIKPDEADLCCGTPLGFHRVDDFLLLTFHTNPSAATVVVLNNDLKAVETLYGFGMNRIAPNEVVLTENMVHFAPVHPERLQWTSLGTGKSLEIYPLSNDVLRNRFDSERKKKEPEVCKRSEEQCNGDDFDEGCAFLGGNGKGKFALNCGRSAEFRPGEEQVPIVYASDDAIYIYAHNERGWKYCEQAITGDEAKQLELLKERAYESIEKRCTPSLPVIPDMSTSDYSPFPKPKRLAK